MFLPAAGWLSSCVASMAAYFACQACQCVSREVLTQSARVAWSALFFLGMIAAWVLRDFAKPLLEKIPWIVRDHFEFGDEWFGQQAVYRVSLGQFMFFASMSVAMLGVKYKSDKRDIHLHHGNYLLKLLAWFAFTAVTFLFPNGFVEAYAYTARFGSGLFLVIQMVILLDFVQQWNDSWVANAEEDQNWLYALLAVTVGAYAGCVTLAGLMYHWFHPSGASCALNVSLITVSLLLCLAFSGASLMASSRGGSIFPASVISMYCMYLCFSALQSEPRDYECNGIGQQMTAASGSTQAVGMVFTLLSVVYAAFRAGSNSKLFTLDGSVDAAGEHAERVALLAEEAQTSAGLDGVPEGQAVSREPTAAEAAAAGRAIDEFAPVSYNYSFFHMIFALASMYIAMLMTGWGSEVQEKDLIDVGWTSVWIKTVAEWTTGVLYAWTLIAPTLFPDRDFA